MALLERFFPDIYVKSVFELPLEDLKKLGIRGLVFDIDNTVAPFDVAEPDEEIVELFAFLRKEGFKLCFCPIIPMSVCSCLTAGLEQLAIHKGGKPGIKKLNRAMEIMGTTPKTTAMVGDQVFTDMWCGHRGGLLCIMTAPICNRDQLITKVKRGAERQVMKVYFKKYGK